MKKNETTGGRCFSESSKSIGDQSSNSDEEEYESNSMVEISLLLPKSILVLRKLVSPKPLQKFVQAKKSSSPTHKKTLQYTTLIFSTSVCALHEEEGLSHWGIGNDSVVWGKEVSRNLKEPSSIQFKSVVEAQFVFRIGPQTSPKSVSKVYF